MSEEHFRLEFRDRFLCDHDGLVKGDMCYGCGTPYWKANEDIKEKIHKNELRRIKEINEALKKK